MTKALQLARSFHDAGHRVILTETSKYRLTGHRFSRSVDLFLIVPEPASSGYAQALLDIVKTHNVDVYIPVCSPAASHYDSLAIPLLDAHCDIIHLSPDRIEGVDDKYIFARATRALGLDAPKSIEITDPAQVMDYDFSTERRPFILKSIAYDAMRRLDLTFLPRPNAEETRKFLKDLPISPENPWVMQEFIEGAEFCTHGTVRDGRLTVHCACASSPFQINYEHIDRPDIRGWVEIFVRDQNLTGQVSFDFIEAEDNGRLYAIECNPRTHSAITLFHDNPDLPDAYLGRRESSSPLEPALNAKATYWFYHEVLRFFRSFKTGSGIHARLRILALGRDAIFDWSDPLPFFMVHHIHIPSLLWGELKAGKGWHRIDFNIGKLVQAGGD